MGLDLFHPLVARWFAGRFREPTPPQAAGWAAIARGEHTLISAPTGSGKTLAAFLWSLDTLVRQASAFALPDETAVVYVSPLRALGNDIHLNLAMPLAEIRRLASDDGTPLADIRVAVRSGDTSARDRAAMTRRPPHILITTPESLYILLTAERSRAFLRTARTVIVDEIHAIAGDKRGAHLALSLERLDLLTGRRCQRIGLSATVRPIDEVARLLVGAPKSAAATGGDGGQASAAAHQTPHATVPPPARSHAATSRIDDCTVVDVGHRRPWDLSVEVPGPPRGPIATHETWDAVYDRLAALVETRRATLVFVNTRRLVERVAHQLTQRLGEDRVAAHHGSLSRRLRLEAEQGLRSGRVPVIVATASLELGIDIGHVDLVCHVGAPRALAQLLQRVGRSGHWLGSVPRGVLFPMTRDELIQCAAAVRSARAGQLDGVVLPRAPLDVLAQQIVAAAAVEEISEDTLYALIRRAYPYRAFGRAEFEQVVAMLSEGIARRLGRTTALVHRDRSRGVLRGRRGARLAAITSGGAIPDTSDYEVVQEPEGTVVGAVNEDFAVESMAGDVFLLGNMSWRIRRVEAGRVRVENAHGAPPSVPFWLGEMPGRTPELSVAVSELREEIATRLADRDACLAWLAAETGLDAEGAAQAVDYIAETVAVLGCVPTRHTIVAERFFDEGGGMQLVLHAPFGARINRAWGLSLRKRFCLTFDFELQAAATDDGIVLSLGPQHSFPLESIFAFVRNTTVRDDLVQATLQSPAFGTRWRWNATRSLALLRRTGGRRVPAQIQRMRAEDLLAAVFPEQVGCQDNHSGPITAPDHPLVSETLHDCLQEWMDLDGLRPILTALERGTIRKVAVDTPTPSAISQELLHANPYAFLDDAPLEERRARAVALRRADPELARTAGALDPAAIAEVAAQAWPDVRSADDLHDHLLTLGVLPVEDAAPWEAFATELVAARRAAVIASPSGRGAYVATDRLPLVLAALPDAHVVEADTAGGPQMTPGAPHGIPAPVDASEAVREIVHGWVQCTCPVTAAGLARRIGLAPAQVEAALAALEGTGVVLRGQFTPRTSVASPVIDGIGPGGSAATTDTEWCERRLLARIHRLTLGRLRREIEPVSPTLLMRFLLRWQHVHPGTQVHGREGVAEIVGMLQGLELPAPAWEEHIFPARIRAYDPADLDALCLAGTVAWGRLTRTAASRGREDDAGGRTQEGGRRWPGPSRAVPIAFVLRDDLPAFLQHDIDVADGDALRGAASDVARFLRERGASFLPEIVRGVRRLPAEVEAALWELVGAGIVTGDGLAGLRRLISRTARARGRHRRTLARAGLGYESLRLDGRWPAARAGASLFVREAQRGAPTRRGVPAGRWALWGAPRDALGEDERHEVLARQLLRRYGIVFRDLLARERCAPPWRLLSRTYGRLEARGEIRGGRFVAGFTGEQFALPEAVEALRAVRRGPEDAQPVVLSAADPLNLTGIVLPGPRVSSLSGLSIAFRNGAAVDVAPHGALLARVGHAALATPQPAG
jgi:ATP-dependent Lhr-like helicase